MAWNHNARNRSAEVRRVNYHEDGPDRTNKNNNRHSNNQEPNKIFNAFVGGLLLFTLASWGFGEVGELISSIKGNIDDTKEVVEQLTTSTDTNTTSSTEISEASNTNGIAISYEVEAEDVQEFLEAIFNTETANIDTNSTTIIEIDYSAFDSDTTYQQSILSQLNSLTPPVIFITTNTNYLTDSEFNTEYTRIQNIVNNSTVKSNSYSNVSLSGTANYPEEGNLSLAITFS